MMHAIERIFQLKFDSVLNIRNKSSIETLSPVSYYGYQSRDNITILLYIMPSVSRVLYNLMTCSNRIAIDGSFSHKSKYVLRYIPFRNIETKLFNRRNVTFSAATFRLYLL